MYACWAAGFYLVFKNNFKEFQTYEMSLYSLLDWRLPNSDSIDWEENANNSNQQLNAIEICIYIVILMEILNFKFLKALICVYMLAFIQVTVEVAQDFEYTFSSETEEQNLATLSSIQKKVDKFTKSYLSEHDQAKLEKSKVIAWLNKDLYLQEDLLQIEEECYKVIQFIQVSQNELKLQCFTNIVDLIQFLKFLFQIKPQLLFKSSVYFRIIVDIENQDSGLQFEYLMREQKILEYQNIARLLNMLKDKGSRVPLLLNFNSKFQPQEGILRYYYKIYPYLHLNALNLSDLKEFILNENIKRWQKKMIVRDQEANEEEEEEEYEVIEQE